MSTHDRLVLLVGLLAMAASACALQSDLPDTPPEGLPAAWFHDDCAPWDGPATTLYLGASPVDSPFEASFPFLRISLYRDRPASGSRIAPDLEAGNASATYCTSETHCIPVTGVVLEISEVRSDLITGRVGVDFAEGPPLRGSFRATRIPFRALCG
jgi:hypothetical protein